MNISELLSAPVAARTNTYSPVSHSEIHNTITDLCSANGFEIESVDVRGKNPRSAIVMYGLRDTEAQNLKGIEKELGIRIGFRNSYDRTMSFGFAIGSLVFICSNGMVSGEYTIRKQHRMSDLNVYVKGLIRDYFQTIRGEHQSNIRFAKQLDGISVTQKDAQAIIGGMFIGNTMTNAQLRKMASECYSGTNFRNFSDNDTISGWDLYNHGTEALKTSANRNYFSRHVEYNDYIRDVFAIAK